MRPSSSQLLIGVGSALVTGVGMLSAAVSEGTGKRIAGAGVAATGAAVAAVAAGRARTAALRRESEDRFREVVEHVGDMVSVVSPDGTTLYVSPSVEQLGYTPAELVGTMVWGNVHPDDRPAVVDTLRGVLAGPGAVKRVEARYQHKDGSWRVLAASGRFVPGLFGTGAVVVNSQDVTGRRAVEDDVRRANDDLERRVEERTAALRESEDRFRVLTEGMPQLVWSCLPDGWCDYLSRQWLEYTGRPHDEQVGYGWLDAVHPADRDRVAASWREAVAGRAA